MLQDKKLLTPEYYYSKISMFMQQAYGMKDRIRILVDFLKYIDMTGDELCRLLNIWEKDYKIEPRFLEKIGKIAGIERTITIFNTDKNNEKENIVFDIDNKVDNDDFLKLIKVKLVQNNYDGTLESLLNLYKEIGINIYINTQTSATVELYLESQNTEPSKFEKIFLYANYFIESLGIKYVKHLISDLDILFILPTNWETLEDEIKVNGYVITQDGSSKYVYCNLAKENTDEPNESNKIGVLA